MSQIQCEKTQHPHKVKAMQKAKSRLSHHFSDTYRHILLKTNVKQMNQLFGP